MLAKTGPAHEPAVLILDAPEAGVFSAGDHAPCYLVIDHDLADAGPIVLL